MKLKVLLSLLLALAVSAWPAPVLAQETPQESQPPDTAAPPPPPSVLQLAARAQLLADSAALALRTIDGLTAVDQAQSDLDEAQRRHEDLQTLLTSMVGADFVRMERLSRVRDQAVLEDSRLLGIRERLTGRLQELGGIHAEWTQRRELWRSWLDGLAAEAELSGAELELDTPLQRIEEVREKATAAASLPLDLLRRVEALRRELEGLSTTVTTIQAQRRQALFERSQPLLFSGAHREQLQEGGWRAWDPTASIQPRAYEAFARGNAGMLGFHLFLALFLGAIGRAGLLAARGEGVPEESEFLEHPWALGLFISTMVAMARVTLAPPLWDVLLWVLFGATAVILREQVISRRPLRRLVYLLAAFYPAFLLLEVAQLPESVFRVGLAVVAAAAIPLALQLARLANPAATRLLSFRMEDIRKTWSLHLGAAVWAGVLLCLILGFEALARWTLHVTVMSAAVAFTIKLGMVLLAAGATTLSRLGREGGLLRHTAALLAHRLIFLLRLALVVAGGLVLLDIWGVAASPVATWQRIMEAGFAVGTVSVTVGRVLLGVLVVYLAVLVSSLIRAVLSREPRPDESSDGVVQLLHEARGVGESITKLAHYALVSLGVILALAVMGVELQNFAIIAGALGIGVGFGLQNVVNNFASGLILLFERPVRVGDTVVVGDVWGTIQKIGLRSTIMLTLDESEMIVPNGDLVSEKVINWTLTSPIARMFLPVGVAYGSPVEKVLEILAESAFAHPSVLKSPPPQTLFIGFGDSSLDFELRVWVQNIGLRLEMRSVVLAEINRRLNEAGIEIPFPQRDLHLRSIDGEALKQLTETGKAPEP
ncbi:MAG: mechanosensitive ion channel domain-containing protein [Gemmatimonadota bacterium]